MPDHDVFTPSEAILLNGTRFAKSSDPLHAFPLPLPGEHFVDEKELAIVMLTAAFYSNIKSGFLCIRKMQQKSILQDDPFMVSLDPSNQASWPKDTLEYTLHMCFRQHSGGELTLFQLFNNAFPRPVYDSPWRDIGWGVCNGLYQRNLLNAETVNLSSWVKTKGNRFRVGKYEPIPGYPYEEATRKTTHETKIILSHAAVGDPELWKTVRSRIVQPKQIR